MSIGGVGGLTRGLAIAYRSARAIAEGTKAVEERGVVGRRLK